MARIDNLTNFLTDVATAIKGKTGKTDAITPAIFDTEIASIESGGSNGIKIEFQTYTPAENEIEHTFTHSLGVVPDFIMIYYGSLPSFSSQNSTSYTLINAWGVKDGCSFFSNGKDRFTQNFYCVSQNAGSDDYAKTASNLNYGIDNTSNKGMINNATENNFRFYGNVSNDSHLGSGLNYHIILMSGVGE